jgi:uncharacterized RDD family membrane protein YckC
MENVIYPGLLLRIKAAVTDYVILLLLIFSISFIFNEFENVPNYLRIAAFVFIFLLYDPLFTSLFGGTIGHRFNGIRVKKEGNKEKNIFFHFALIRYLLKVFLGWISLLTINENPKGKAIHDVAVGSIVIFKNDKKKTISYI